MTFENKKTQGYQMGSLPPQGSRNKPPIYQGTQRDKQPFNLGEKNKPSIKKQGNK